MTKEYIEKNFKDIKKHADAIEKRLDDSDCTMESVIAENIRNLQLCKEYGCNYILIEDKYNVDIKL